MDAFFTCDPLMQGRVEILVADLCFGNLQNSGPMFYQAWTVHLTMYSEIIGINGMIKISRVQVSTSWTLQVSYPFSETNFKDFPRTFPRLRLIFQGLLNSHKSLHSQDPMVNSPYCHPYTSYF